MNRRVLWIVCAGVAVALLLAWLLFFRSGRMTPVEEDLPATIAPTPTPAPKQQVVLLFPGRDGLLHPELRQVSLPKESDTRIQVLVEELLAGPTSGLAPVIPYSAELRAVFVGQNNQAYIDLTGPPEPLGGSMTELMLTYGLVNTILLNTEVTAVQLLFDGSQRPTLTGHLDLSRPLVLNKRFISGP